MENTTTETVLRVSDYDLAATLDSGQAFRWHRESPVRGQLARVIWHPAGEPPALRDRWVGVIGNHWVRLTQTPDGIHAAAAGPVADWQWLHDYLQTGLDLAAVLETFPDDAPLRDAVAACRGLRLLRQDPWECLASFILSSTKQIVQIRQIVARLCERFGEPVSQCSVEPAARLNFGRRSNATARLRRSQPAAPFPPLPPVPIRYYGLCRLRLFCG